MKNFYLFFLITGINYSIYPCETAIKNRSRISLLVEQCISMSRTKKIMAISTLSLAGLGAYLFLSKSRILTEKLTNPLVKHPTDSKVYPEEKEEISIGHNTLITNFVYDQDMPQLNILLFKEWPRLYNRTLDSSDNPSITLRFKDRLLNTHPVQIRIARVDSQIAGFITYYKVDPTKGHIDLLAVDEKFRKKGLATALLQTAENNLKKQCVNTVDILVLNTNTTAQHLYKKIGFKDANGNTPQTTWLHYIKDLIKSNN